MPRFLYFGRGGGLLDSLVEAGGIQVQTATEAEAIVVETYDNKSSNPVERLTGTIELVRKALDEIEHSPVQRMIVIADQSSTKGKMRKGASSGVAVNDVHGFGTLTAEVLSRRAANLGVSTKVFRIKSSQEQDTKSEILSTLLGNDDSITYSVMTLGA
tara:strand:+ start:1555 stop:2028 length:474 start_codon:yes stop_codon:yes gene_type:complete